MEWTEDIIVRLRSLWVEGHSTAEIGRRLVRQGGPTLPPLPSEVATQSQSA